MGSYFPAQAKVHPSYTEPGLIVTYTQPSGAFEAIPNGSPKVRLGPEDLYVYANGLDLRTATMTAQASSNFLPSSTLVGNYYSTSAYLIRTRASWDHHDIAAAANYSVSLPAAQDMASRQGIFQQMRTMLLYGFQPANGEGLMNSPGAVQVTLPPDSYGQDTVVSYDNGQMALFLLSQVQALLNGMYQINANIRSKIKMIGPQRVLSYFQMSSVVQVTSYQRPGAGTATVGQEVQNIVGEAAGDIEYYYDDTLIGKGIGGSDAIILTVPEIEVPSMQGINTNEFGKLQPSIQDVNAMYSDMAAPMKIPTPVPDGGITEVQELRCTSGWNLRPQGLYILNLPYSG